MCVTTAHQNYKTVLQFMYIHKKTKSTNIIWYIQVHTTKREDLHKIMKGFTAIN